MRGDAGRDRVEERAAAVAGFRATARSFTRREPPAPKPRKRVRSGGDGRGYGKGAAGGLVQDYLELCRDPLKDLRRWAAEDKRFGRAPRGFQSVFVLRATPDKSFIAKGDDHAHNQGRQLSGKNRRVSRPAIAGVAATAGRGQEPRAELTVCLLDREPVLAEMTDCDQVSSRKRRFERGGLVSRIGGEAGSYGAAADAINAEFAEKLDGLRRRLPRWQIPAAVRALKNARAVALQALRDQKQGERFAAREITRRAQAGFPPTARPS